MNKSDKRQRLPSSHDGALFARVRLALLVALGPLLWLQGRHVRRVTPRLPEPDGPRAGIAGQGPALRLLIAGDSAAAGVGAASQAEALSGQLVQHLACHFCVHWELWATTGHTSEDLSLRLQQARTQHFDVVVLSIGVNDVTALRAPRPWVAQQAVIASELRHRFAPSLVIHSAVPPMHAFTALPQPLRWFMGQWARAMNRQLAEALKGHPWRVLYSLPSLASPQKALEALATDGFHPGPPAYAVWGAGLAQQIRNFLLSNK
jgi:lysophospholipase L1-like esterase